MYTCAQCAAHACSSENPESLPKNCPMRDGELLEACFANYAEPENHDFYVTCSAIEALGYGQWVRLKETIELCKRMGYHRVGMAFCRGLRDEAKVIDKLLRAHGFEVVSVICKTGGVPKEKVGISQEHKVHPNAFEPMCNPIAQAKLLNKAETEFNIAVGLCVGHDSLFYKYCDALVTTLIAKDRVLAHNPAGAVYCAEGYFREKLKPQD